VPLTIYIKSSECYSSCRQRWYLWPWIQPIKCSLFHDKKIWNISCVISSSCKEEMSLKQINYNCSIKWENLQYISS